MPSKLEDTLLRCWQTDGNVRRTLFDYLDDGTSLHNLRACSRPLKDILDHEPARLWRNLYTDMPLRPKAAVPNLEQGAAFCQHLTISIGFNRAATNHKRVQAPKRSSGIFKKLKGRNLFRGKKATDSQIVVVEEEFPFTPDLPQNFKILERKLWLSIIRTFANIFTLTIRVNGHPAWRGRDEPERTLLLLRQCLENAGLSHLRNLELNPVHGMGILHLRWGAFGAFGKFEDLPNHRALRFWQNITSLDVRLRNPLAREGEIYGKQYVTFLKILNDYLRTFSRNLRCFKFAWLDREGPNPLSLHLEEEMATQMPLQWPILEEFWFGKIAQPNQVLASIPERAPGVNIIKILRSVPSAGSTNSAVEETWLDVSHERIASIQADNRQLRAESVYSQLENVAPRTYNPVAGPAPNRVKTYKPNSYAQTTPIRRGRANLAPAPSSSVYPQSQVAAMESDPYASGISTGEAESLHAIKETDALNVESDPPIRRGKANPLFDRTMLAGSSIYSSFDDPYASRICTMVSESDLRRIMSPAPLDVARRKTAEASAPGITSRWSKELSYYFKPGDEPKKDR